MKKVISIISLLFITTFAAKAEVGVGITGAAHFFEVSGTETVRQSGAKNSGDHSDEALVPELFIESIADNGAALGIAYIPTRTVGSKTRTDTANNTGDDAGSYKAEAELDNVIQVYADVPVGQVAGFTTHLKFGVQHATIETLESLNSGSTYPNKDIFGASFGFGIKGDVPYGDGLYFKGEAVYTDFQDYEATSSGSNKIEAELDDLALKLSIGKTF